MRPNARLVLATLFTLECTMIPTIALAGSTVTQDISHDSGVVCYGSAGVNGLVSCFQSQGVFHQVTTPSGNQNNTHNGTWTLSTTIYDGTGKVSSTIQQSGDDHTKLLFKPGEVTKGHSFTQSDTIIGASGMCMTTIIEYDYNFTTNQVMQDNYTFTYSAC